MLSKHVPADVLIKGASNNKRPQEIEAIDMSKNSGRCIYNTRKDVYEERVS